jgi:hypothetical protein
MPIAPRRPTNISDGYLPILQPMMTAHGLVRRYESSFELVRSRSIERGFYLGVVNKRGATWRRPTDGGVQERELAKNYRKLAKNLRLEWPHTAGVLEQLSQHYARDGVDSDEKLPRLDMLQ